MGSRSDSFSCSFLGFGAWGWSLVIGHWSLVIGHWSLGSRQSQLNLLGAGGLGLVAGSQPILPLYSFIVLIVCHWVELLFFCFFNSREINLKIYLGNDLPEYIVVFVLFDAVHCFL